MKPSPKLQTQNWIQVSAASKKMVTCVFLLKEDKQDTTQCPPISLGEEPQPVLRGEHFKPQDCALHLGFEKIYKN